VSQNNINTVPITQFLNQVRAAELSNQREIRLNIVDAKNLSYTLSLVMTRLAGDYEGLIQKNNSSSPVINVQMDGGSWDEK
jgi:hypothetical protein